MFHTTFTTAMALAISLMLVGCSGANRDAQSPMDSSDPGSAYAGPRADAGDADQAGENTALDTVAASPESAVRRAGSGNDDAEPGGRPSWWFDGVRAEGGVVSACAEALAADLLDARRKAVEVGRQRLAQAIDHPLDQDDRDIRIVRTHVSPLPAARGGSFRYVAYVQVSLAPDEQ